MLEGQLGNLLNPVQQEAVAYCDGPELVIAGAGSGKTRVLTCKIAYLLQHYDMKPWNILALTFTNKAAREMKARIAGLVGDERAARLQMGTFHSIFARILRIEADAIGYSSNYTIYDETDSRSLLKNITKQMQLDDKAYKPAAVHSVISRAKNQLWTAEMYASDGSRLAYDKKRNMPELHSIYTAYQQRLKAANAMDFDDLLVLTYKLLRENEDIRQKYADRFKYVLVDEYQDTNYVQQQILILLTHEHRHICVVGDDYQSIYAFRGARIDNILDFQDVFQEARLFKLEQNYRSTQNIVSAANALMKHNRHQIDKNVFSRNAEGEKPVVIECATDKREAAVVCREIKRIRAKEHCKWSDFAILYRTNAQSRTFEEEMRKPEVGMGSHYQIYGGLSFYQRKEIKDIIAYFRLVVNPDDEEALRRIINYPTRGIGAATLQKLADLSNSSGMSAWSVIDQEVSGRQISGAFTRATLEKLRGFHNMIMSFIAQRETADALALGKEIIEKSGITADLAVDSSSEGDARRENVNELVSAMAAFIAEQKSIAQAAGTQPNVLLSNYLATVSLLTDQDNADDSDDKLSMMTIHAAKGLEFGTVFVVGLEENIFPSMMSVDNERDIEEERRLLYVAITRAEHHCFLTWAHTRWRFGKMDAYVHPSRFLDDIDKNLLSMRSDGADGNSLSGGHSGGYGFRRGWEDDYTTQKPYIGFNGWNQDSPRHNPRMQNSRPVASQFVADAKPKVTSPVVPSWRKVTVPPHPAPTDGKSHESKGSYPLAIGDIVEHSRFGRGRVTDLSGTGENAKATVDFDKAGQKQLLLKFARLTKV